MIENLLWMAAGAALYHFFPNALLTIWKGVKSLAKWF